MPPPALPGAHTVLPGYESSSHSLVTRQPRTVAARTPSALECPNQGYVPFRHSPLPGMLQPPGVHPWILPQMLRAPVGRSQPSGRPLRSLIRRGRARGARCSRPRRSAARSRGARAPAPRSCGCCSRGRAAATRSSAPPPRCPPTPGRQSAPAQGPVTHH